MLVHLDKEAGAAGAGHAATLVGLEDGRYAYYSYGSGNDKADPSDNLEVVIYRDFYSAMKAVRQLGYNRYAAVPISRYSAQQVINAAASMLRQA